jgi:hypothetical protein
MGRAGDARFLTTFADRTNVAVGGGVSRHLHHGQRGRDGRGSGVCLDFGAQFFAERASESATIEYMCSHAVPFALPIYGHSLAARMVP